MFYIHSYAFSPLLLTDIINRTVYRKLFMMCSLFAGLKVAAQQPSAKNPVAPRPVIIPCKGILEKDDG